MMTSSDPGQMSFMPLETSGKLAPEEAYQQIKALWKQLKRSKKELGIGQNPFQSDNHNDEGNQSSENN